MEEQDHLCPFTSGEVAYSLTLKVLVWVIWNDMIVLSVLSLLSVYCFNKYIKNKESFQKSANLTREEVFHQAKEVLKGVGITNVRAD